MLFILRISSNTQARYEGDCRLEGALATERAMSIAPADASIGPIIMGATRAPAALVPDRFRVGPWTRLPGGEVTPEVRARFLTLWSHRAGAVVAESEVARVSRPVSPNDTGEEPRATPKVGRALRARRLWATAVLLVVRGAGGYRGDRVCIAHRAANIRPVLGRSGPVHQESRGFVARFENLSGEPALDLTGRVIADHFRRYLPALNWVREVVAGRRPKKFPPTSLLPT